jgi:hypothetical protein
VWNWEAKLHKEANFSPQIFGLACQLSFLQYSEYLSVGDVTIGAFEVTHQQIRTHLIAKTRKIFVHLERRVLRKIFGPKRDEVTEDWRKLRKEELYDLYSSPYSGNKIEKNEMGGACST